MNKMTCGSTDQYVEIAEKRDDDSKNKEVTFVILQKK